MMMFPVWYVIVYGASILMVLSLVDCGMTVTWPNFTKLASPSPAIAHLSSLFLFSDDTKCYRSISAVSDFSSAVSDLNDISDCCSEWNLTFNATKCNLSTFTRNLPQLFLPVTSSMDLLLCHQSLVKTFSSLFQMVFRGPLTINILLLGPTNILACWGVLFANPAPSPQINCCT